MSIFKKSSITLVLKILSSLSGLLLNYLVAQNYSPELAGDFFLALTLVLILSQVSRLGTDSHLVRIISNNQDSEYRSIVFFLVIISGLFFTLTLFFMRELIGELFSSEHLSSILIIMSFSVIFYSLGNHFAFYGQGIKSPYLFVLGSNFLQVAFTALFLLVMSSMKMPGDEALGLSYALGCMISFVFLYIYLIRYKGYRTFKVDGFLLKSKRLIGETSPLLFSTFFQLCTVWFSQFIVAYFLSSADVAAFTISQRIAMLTSFILVSINSVVSPRYAVLYATGNMRKLKEISQAATALGLVFVFPFLIAICLFPEMILSVFGDFYVSATNVLVILSLAQVLNVATGGVGYLLQMSGHYKEVMFSNVIGFFSVLIVGPFLINHYGMIGGAFTSLIGVLTCNLYLFFRVKTILGFYNITFRIKALRNIL